MAATPSPPRGPQTPAITRAKSPVAAHPITSAVIAILVAAAIFFILYTPVYASVTPKIGSWPFFYFYMLIYMPATSLVLWVVMVLQKRLGPASQDQGTEGEVRS
jgi:Na+/melibiose symporter-like transporter